MTIHGKDLVGDDYAVYASFGDVVLELSEGDGDPVTHEYSVVGAKQLRKHLKKIIAQAERQGVE